MYILITFGAFYRINELMNKALFLLFLTLLAFKVSASEIETVTARDTNEVIKLNKSGYDNRLRNPGQTVIEAQKALSLAQELNYTAGIAEAYRILGIGNYYLDQPNKSIEAYLNSLSYFTKNNDLRGEAKVYNNIGILLRDHDYDRSLEYLNKSLVIAQKFNDTKLKASLYLNLGTVYYRKKSFYEALSFYDKSDALFHQLKDSTNLTHCLQDRGVIYFNLHEYTKAEQLLLEANKQAKAQDLNESLASIDLTLSSLYILKGDFDNAVKTVEEGLAFARILKDPKLEYDYNYTRYELELKRGNYQQAVSYLRDIYKHDSTIYKNNVSTQLNLSEARRKQEEQQRETEQIIQRQKYQRVMFWGVTIVSGLLLMVVALLIGNVRRKKRTNARLTELNSEVSRQKDNLDRINHHLEEIIDERTKDLQTKNKKLSEYSSYLSHQIRGPIATLKGLMNLEKEGLVDQQECISMMNKCVSEIDEKIIDMSDMLHDPSRTTF